MAFAVALPASASACRESVPSARSVAATGNHRASKHARAAASTRRLLGKQPETLRSIRWSYAGTSVAPSRPFFRVAASAEEVADPAPSTPPAPERYFPPSLLSSPVDPRVIEWFAAEAAEGTVDAVDGGMKRMNVFVQIPELDPSVDVYRLRSVLQVAWEIVLAFAAQGKRVKVCIQGVGQQFGGMPLAVAGIRRALEGDLRVSVEDGTYSEMVDNVRIGAIGPASVEEDDDIFILVSPTNTIGQAVIQDVRAMAEAVGNRPFIMLNARLADVPSYEGIMGVQGRAERLAFLATFDYSYYFRLLYTSATDYPIRGALYRKSPGPWEVYAKDDGAERYRLLSVSAERPARSDTADLFARANDGGEAGRRADASLAATVGVTAALGAALLYALVSMGPIAPQ